MATANSISETRLKLAPGDTLFREGDHGDCAYFVEQGELDIIVERDGCQLCIARSSVGDILGEMAVIDGGARSASAIAVTECFLIKITRAQIQNRIESLDAVTKHCIQTILDRYRQTLGQFSSDQTISFQSQRHHRNPAKQEAIDVIRLEHDLQTAIGEDHLRLYLQPVISLADMQMAGFEALIRWQHPNAGLIPPDKFIPQAEKSGLICSLTGWIVDRSLAFIQRLTMSAAAAQRLFLSINISAADLMDPNFLGMLEAGLERYEIDGHRIKLEVTEGAMMQNASMAARTLESCRDMGFAIAIDDFGTGYSSFGYLRDYPLQCLKIDRSFVSGIETDQRSRQIVASMIAMGKGLDMDIVAEGIETEGQKAILSALGCQYAQGYLFAKPIPEDQIDLAHLPQANERRARNAVLDA